MKIFQTNILPGFIFLVASLPLFLNSCTKDETDLRDEITGRYDYTVKIYAVDGDDLIYLGDQGDNYDIDGTMEVVKNPGGLRILDFYDGDDLMFQGVNVMHTGNSIVFDIPDQEAWIGPTKVLIAGYKYWDVNASSYDGAFLYEDDSIEIAFKALIMNADTGLVMILTAFRK